MPAALHRARLGGRQDRPTRPAPDRRGRQDHGRRLLPSLGQRNAAPPPARRAAAGPGRADRRPGAGRQPGHQAPRASRRMGRRRHRRAGARHLVAQPQLIPQQNAGPPMENLDLTVLRTLHGWGAAQRGAPRGPPGGAPGPPPPPGRAGPGAWGGGEGGAGVGWAWGGCSEAALTPRHTRARANPAPSAPLAPTAPEHGIPNGPPAFVKYGISADEAHRFGLPCGGTLELLLEYNPDPARLAELLALLAAGRLVQRSVRPGDGAGTPSPATAPADLARADRQPTQTFGPEYRMLLIGAGQLAEYLATMAMFNGFAVTVCDPREEYRQSWNLPGAALLSDMPDDVVLAFKPDRRSCVVALTHDPKLDDLALLEALETDAFYVGGIGSRRNHQARRKRMIEHFGQTPDRLARLRGPIGIYIGSKTPPEIAVSVMAEILALKNGVTLPHDVEVAQAKNERDLAHNDPGTALCAASPASSATGPQYAPRP